MADEVSGDDYYMRIELPKGMLYTVINYSM